MKNTQRAMAIGALVAVTAVSVSAATYKWVDAQGRVQYSDTPPPASAKGVEKKTFSKNTVETSGQPFALQEAVKKNPVTLWVNDCGELCNKARDLLNKRGVPFTERNPAKPEEHEEFKKLTGGGNELPLLLIGTDKSIKGFEEGQWISALDAAGYPKNLAPTKGPQK